MTWCAQCGDEFAAVEYRPPSVDDPNFCSDLCEQIFEDRELGHAQYESEVSGGV